MKYLFAAVAVSAAGCASAAAQQTPAGPASTGSAAADESVIALPAESAPAIAAPSFSGGASAAAIASIPAGPLPAGLPQETKPAGEEVKVTAPRMSSSPLREERLIGTNEQPEWTTERRWAKTRAYVLAPGQIEFEQWYKLQMPKGSAPDHFFQTELGFGLEGGWQVDLYENWGQNPGEATKHEGVQFEVRKALAKWGEMWANPTLYAEYVWNEDAADKAEFKLLLADEICPGWHWGTNFVYEQETSGARETELAWSGAISYTLQDSKFSVGAEFNLEHVTGEGFQSHDKAINEFLLGPSLQWRPTENSHLDFVPLFGLTASDREDPRYEIWVIFGWDFGPDQDPGRYSGPASTRSR